MAANYVGMLASSMKLLTGGSQVGALRKKLLPLLANLENTVERDLKDFPWNWEYNFRACGREYKKFSADFDALYQDLSTKQFLSIGLSVSANGGIIFGAAATKMMIQEIVDLLRLINDLKKVLEQFKKGFERVKAYIKRILSVKAFMDSVYAEFMLAFYELQRAILRKAEVIKQLLILKLKLATAQIRVEQYKLQIKALNDRLETAPNNQQSIIRNLIRTLDKSIKSLEADILSYQKNIAFLEETEL